MAAYLPMSTLEFPVLVKQFFSSVMKDIIDVEAVKTPHITKLSYLSWYQYLPAGMILQFPQTCYRIHCAHLFELSRLTDLEENIRLYLKNYFIHEDYGKNRLFFNKCLNLVSLLNMIFDDAIKKSHFQQGCWYVDHQGYILQMPVQPDRLEQIYTAPGEAIQGIQRP